MEVTEEFRSDNSGVWCSIVAEAMTMSEVEIKIGKEWCRVHGRTAAIVADGRHSIPSTATGALCYWVLQLMLHGY